MNTQCFAWILLLLFFHASNGYKILLVAPVAARSHYILMSALAKGLAEAGHDVTIISPYKTKDYPTNGTYREVQTAVETLQELPIKFFDMEKMGPIGNCLLTSAIGNVFTEATLTHPNFQKLLNSNEHFDAVIIEQFVNDALKVIAHHYKAPLILFSTIGANDWTNNLVGNPAPYSYVPSIFLNFGYNMNFWQRSYNFFVRLFLNLHEYLIFYPEQEKIMKKYFPEAPDLNELLYNASLVLINSHESVNQPLPHVPNMVQIGGFHIQPPKKLPTDLQTFLDGATEGVIYFSLGSNVKPSEMSNQTKDAIIQSFAKLNQKVLWKWDEDAMAEQLSNIKISKWFPQQDILAHPNVKLFITHAGLLSITEAIDHGVPLLSLPVFGDQKLNALRAEHSGFGLTIPFAQITEGRFTEALQKLLFDPQYRSTAKRRSALMHDRPVKPIDLAVYWTEFVIRHGGSPHLKISGVDLPWYQYFSLDVIAFVIVVIVLISVFVMLAFRRVCLSGKKFLSRKKETKYE